MSPNFLSNIRQIYTIKLTSISPEIIKELTKNIWFSVDSLGNRGSFICLNLLHVKSETWETISY